MNPLFILLQTSGLTEGAKRMAETDPHGWTLTIIAVTTVFSALVILYLIFTLVGKISMRMDARNAAPAKPAKKPKKPAGNAPDAEVAAAIALALEAENGGEIPVAIATALALHLGTSVHDSEPFVITINRAPSAWRNPALNFRKNPNK